MSATNNNSATPPSYEAKARATLEVANRIHALPANITSADFTLAEVKSLSEMLLFLMALKENEGVDGNAVLQALSKMHDRKVPPGNSAAQALTDNQPLASYQRTTCTTAIDPLMHAYEDEILNAFHTFKDAERRKYEAVARLQAQKDRMRKVAELKKFQQTFTLQTPVPRDLLSILGKDKRNASTVGRRVM